MKNSTSIPQWAKKVIWYQIFPERFRNGNPNVGPKLEDQEGAYPFDTSEPWEIHPWGSDWYKLQPWEKKNKNDIWRNIRRRRYGGDLQGIIDKLDYLQDLGIDAIYLNPIFYSPSHHLYDTIMHHHIQPSFGPDPEGDKQLIAKEIPDDPTTWHWTSADLLFLKLIEELKKRGMYIIIDGVFNHVSFKNFAFQDVLKNGKKSRFADWFHIDWQQYEKDPSSKFYRSWCGVRDLPELRKVGGKITDIFENECEAILPDGDIAEGPKKYIFEITKRWMRPVVNGKEYQGIDGWRLDASYWIGHKFWKDWRKLVKSLNPNAFIIGEVIKKLEDVEQYLQGDEFDAIMNYHFAQYSAEYFIYTCGQLKPSQFDKQLRELRNKFSTDTTYTMQNLFDSHDTPRLASQIANPCVQRLREWHSPHNCGSREQNTGFNTFKPNSEHYQLMKLMIIFQFTYVGAPYIYYGTEVGMWGADDPCCRKPMLWDDIQYEDECYLPDGTKRENCDKVEINHEILNHYKKLIKIRKNNIALQLGDFQTIITDDKKQIYAFERNYKGQKIIVILNKTKTKQTTTLKIKGKLTDLLNKEKFESNDAITLEINPVWARILLVE